MIHIRSNPNNTPRTGANTGCIGQAKVSENTHGIVDNEGCGNYPVRWATFAGGHICAPRESGQPPGVPGESWEFIS